MYAWSQMAEMTDQIDVVICGGSATDLPQQTSELAKLFTVVDSFDTHANIPTHFANVDTAAREAGTIGIISWSFLLVIDELGLLGGFLGKRLGLARLFRIERLTLVGRLLLG